MNVFIALCVFHNKCVVDMGYLRIVYTAIKLMLSLKVKVFFLCFIIASFKFTLDECLS